MRITTVITVAITSALLALAGGSALSNETHPEAAPHQHLAPAIAQSGGMMEQLRQSCPMMVEDTTVEVSDTEGGVALTFTTASGDVDALRARVQHMAQMYSMHRGHRGMMWHHMGRMGGHGMMGQGHGMGGAGMGQGSGMGSGMGMGRGMMPAATATVEEIDGGAQLVLVPTDASQLDALRQHARMHQQRLQSGECPMLQPESDE